MATDATGAPTSLGIPKFNTAVDAPSGLGGNAQMDAIDALISARVGKPAGIVSGEAPVWNGASWDRSSVTKIGTGSLSGYPWANADIAAGAAILASKLAGFPSDATKALFGDGSWAVPSGAIAPPILMSTGGTDTTNAIVPAVNDAYLIEVVGLVTPTLLNTLQFWVQTQSGNYDIGIYHTDDMVTFTRDFALGSTAVPAAPAWRTISTGGITLTPVVGRRFFYAIAVNNITVRFGGTSSARSFFKAATFPLPATITSPTASASAAWTVIGLR